MSLADFLGTSDNSIAMIKYLELGHIVNNQSTVCSFRISEVQDRSVAESMLGEDTFCVSSHS